MVIRVLRVKGNIMQALIFTKEGCPFCTSAKEFLNGLDIPYQEELLTNQTDRDVFFETKVPLGRGRTFPQIWVSGEYVGGYDDLVEWSFQ